MKNRPYSVNLVYTEDVLYWFWFMHAYCGFADGNVLNPEFCKPVLPERTLPQL